MSIPADIRNDVVKNIEAYEGRVPHLYRDSVGQVTIGVGYLIANRAAVANVALRDGQVPATLAAKQTDFDAVVKQPTGHVASFYKKFTKLTLSDQDITQARDRQLDSFHGELKRIYQKSQGYPSDFDGFPAPARLALFDMIFNLGMTKLQHTFPSLNAAIKVPDWTKASQRCHRTQIPESRNIYVRNLFLAAAKA